MKKTILPENTVRLVEQHRIYPTDPRFAAIDAAAFASKNLYNAANYEVRQHFFATGASCPTKHSTIGSRKRTLSWPCRRR